MKRFAFLPFVPLLLLGALVGQGCATTVVMKELPVYTCVDPIIPCQPKSYDEVTIDTTSSVYGYYMVIDRVDGLDEAPDEFGVAFAPGRWRSGIAGGATIRARDGGGSREAIHPVEFSAVTVARALSPVEAEGLLALTGTPAYRKETDTILLAGRFPGTVHGDYDLVRARLDDDELREVARLSPSRLISWEAQPGLTPDGLTLFYVGNSYEGMGGRTGGTDIYVTRRLSDGSWSTPEMLGPAVNTPCDELSPFVSDDGLWLYFSSSGHQSVGGYDLFRARLTAGTPGKAENLGRPINTPGDELFPSSPSGSSPDTLLYYSSNQPGSNGFDVYVLHRRFRGRAGQASGTERADSLTLTGTIRTNDGRPVDGATVTLDERNPPRRVDSMRSDPDGGYEFEIKEGKQYEVTASKEGNLYGSERVEVPVYNNREVIERDIVFLDTVVFRVNFPFNDASNPYEYTLDDYGLPTDRRWTEVIAQAADVLRRIDPKSGTRIELVGHTDPIGSDAYNIDLGRRRAEFIRRELIARGVPTALLTVRTAGEGLPLPMYPNEQDELYRARLRRVELFRGR